MARRLKPQDWVENEPAPAKRPAVATLELDDEAAELENQARYKQFREALSPFWAWRMSRR